jgi:hypothetical protein
MCQKCGQLDRKIEHYSRLSSWITDEQTIEEIRFFIEKLRAQKAALHPDAPQSPTDLLRLSFLTLPLGQPPAPAARKGTRLVAAEPRVIQTGPTRGTNSGPLGLGFVPVAD